MRTVRTVRSRSSAFFHSTGLLTPSIRINRLLSSQQDIPSEAWAQSPKERNKTKVLSSLSNGKCVDYAKGWAWQQVLLSRRLHFRRKAKLESGTDEMVASTDDDCVLLLEHAPVYTLGRGASENHLTFLADNLGNAAILERLSRKNRGPSSARLALDRRALEEEILLRPVEEAVNILASKANPVLAPNGVPIFRVDRGGEVTFHGPSQLVLYPLLDLKRSPYRADLHWFLRRIEEVVMKTLQHYDIEGVRDSINTGVWVGENKIAAIGVSASSWISTHGFALNVCPDLDFFDTSVILPCGIAERGVTSMHKVLEERNMADRPSVQEVATVALRAMEDVFDLQLECGRLPTVIK